MKYGFKIPKYVKGKWFTEEFNTLFLEQFYLLDPIEIAFETSTQDLGYENYVRNLYVDIIKTYESDLNFEKLVINYRSFKNSYSSQLRWGIYEDFCDYLIYLNKPKLAFEEWILLQEEEGSKVNFTYRDGAIKRLIYFEKLLGVGIIGGYHLHKMVPKENQLTSFGKRNIIDIFKTLDIMVKAEATNSFFEQFYLHYNFDINDKLITLPIGDYEKFFEHNLNSKKHWNRQLNNNSSVILKNGKASSPFVFLAIRDEASRLLREAENNYRLSIGAKKIGQSWIGETELYFKIKNVFSAYEVIQHGRPEWLGRQHFDIWIPQLFVAIEYQGKQHDEPVEFFGGIDAFNKGLKRDQLKRKKCLNNGVRLIEVREGYNLKDIIADITKDS